MWDASACHIFLLPPLALPHWVWPLYAGSILSSFAFPPVSMDRVAFWIQGSFQWLHFVLPLVWFSSHPIASWLATAPTTTRPTIWVSTIPFRLYTSITSRTLPPRPLNKHYLNHVYPCLPHLAFSPWQFFMFCVVSVAPVIFNLLCP